MGEIRIEGLGVIEIEGDAPNERERRALAELIQGTPDPDAPMPATPTAETRRLGGAAGEGLPEGPLGLVPAESRRTVREKIEGLPGLFPLLAEITPATAGAMIGGGLGALIELPSGPVPTTLLGASLGGALGEVIGQESGVAPASGLNLGLAAAGPALGAGAGQALRLARRGIGTGVSKIPPARTAMTRVMGQRAVEEFESLGTKILAKQRGLMARSADDLFSAARRAGVVVKPAQVNKTLESLQALKEEIGEVFISPEVMRAFPEGRKALNFIRGVERSLTQEEIPLNTLVRLRQLVGKTVREAETAGGIRLGSAKQVFGALSDDLDAIAKTAGAGTTRSARAARLAKAATQRAKLQFAVDEFSEGVEQFTKFKRGEEEVIIDFVGLQNFLRDLTTRSSKKFNKNFTAALREELPAVRKRLAELAKITGAGSPGGPGSIVVRGIGAKTGRTVLGGGLGLVLGGPIGAAAGALIGASGPEIMTAALMSRPGFAFLKRTAELGKGTIHSKAWQALGQMLTRSAGEGGEEPPTRAEQRRQRGLPRERPRRPLEGMTGP